MPLSLGLINLAAMSIESTRHGSTDNSAENKKPHVFVFGHEPAFQVKHNDCLAFYPQDRDVFWDSIGKAGARLYFCGHDHLYNRALIMDKAANQIRQIIAGTGEADLDRGQENYLEGDRVKGEYSNL